MGSRPLEIAWTLGVTPKDAETIKTARRKVVLSRIAQVGMTILAALAGFAAGKAMSPSSGSQIHDGYPYSPLWSAPVFLIGMPRRSWIATIIAAAIAFLTFFFMTYDSSGTYGVTPKYGTYCRKERPTLSTRITSMPRAEERFYSGSRL
jgi:hypothetical protein